MLFRSNDFRCVANSSKPDVQFKVPTYKKDENGKNIMTKTGHINHWVEDGFEYNYRPAKFTPEDAVVDHKAMLNYIRLMIEGKFDQKFVVVGHHAPSKTSTHPRYADEQLMNGGYSSSLDEFIIDHPQIKIGRAHV